MVSGRSANDLWQHVLQQRQPHQNWRQQLIPNILAHLEQKGLSGVKVSLAYDAYFGRLTEVEKASLLTKMQAIQKLGDSYDVFYKAFETAIAEYSSPSEDQLVEKLKALVGENFPADGNSSKSSLDFAMPLYMAIHGDTDKTTQFSQIISHVESAYSAPDDAYQFHLWDDKAENLSSGLKHFSNRKYPITCYRVENASGIGAAFGESNPAKQQQCLSPAQAATSPPRSDKPLRQQPSEGSDTPELTVLSPSDGYETSSCFSSCCKRLSNLVCCRKENPEHGNSPY